MLGGRCVPAVCSSSIVHVRDTHPAVRDPGQTHPTPLGCLADLLTVEPSQSIAGCAGRTRTHLPGCRARQQHADAVHRSPTGLSAVWPRLLCSSNGDHGSCLSTSKHDASQRSRKTKHGDAKTKTIIPMPLASSQLSRQLLTLRRPLAQAGARP
jgi:hypothetical protein